MKDVARECGVHQTTVSLALRKHPSIPPHTRERIKAVADRMGYRPNPLVSALISERKKNKPVGDGSTLAFLTHYPTANGWQHAENYVLLRRMMEQRASRLGYKIEDFWIREKGMTPQRMGQILRSRGIRGIILCPFPKSEFHFDFDFSDFAAIAIGLTLVEPRLDRATIDYAALMQQCIDQLLLSGYSRIGFVSNTVMDNRVRHLSLGAFQAARYHQPGKFLNPVLFKQPHDSQFAKWVDSKRPDVLITSNTPEYHAFKKLLQAMEPENHPPEIVSVDSRPDLHAEPGMVHGMVQDMEALAEAAIDFLTSRVERGMTGIPPRPQAITIAGQWRQGNLPRTAKVR
ncbi:LacI family DNA-binding transcriptional regulator [Puniceicoccus vermicola]|uniref:LacI family DNA-binding transcriptional regulator n=1 Tax=Puniceicoccus vermicola TaxID=388746 RepID=A0A7X1B1A1_9BACT|nr:LacI family DNA-binding transcriptional regulator [Puniceicoccus vermicola]MBC2603791.1 LacI family DNA-binding transcriptional regulator [Puniceicoccus vermicola]